MPAPTLTEIVGVPSLPPGATNLQITVTLDPPYQGGPLIGLSASQYDGVRNTDGTRWVFETTNNTPFAFPMARKDAICPPPDGWMRAIITYTLGGKGYRAELKPLRPIAGDDGTLDLSANQFPGGVISITSLSGLIADTTAAKTGALAARDAANAAAAAVPGQVATGLAPVAPALAAMTQAVADNAQQQALASQQAAQARAIALQLQAIYDLSAIQASYDLFSANQLAAEGWTIRAADAGGSRTVQTLGDAGPLELQANPDGSVTLWGDPALFEAILNPDNTTTLWRVT